jgi:hypothetical protein
MRLFFKNCIVIGKHYKTFDYLSFGSGSLLLVTILLLFERALLRNQKWVSSVVPPLSLTAIYATTFCSQVRYFWILLPFILALAFGLGDLMSYRIGLSRNCRTAIFGLIAISFTLNPLSSCIGVLRHRSEETGVSPHREIARRLKENHLQGAVCGSLYVAYFLNEPCIHPYRYYSDVTPCTVEQFLDSGARIIILNRNVPMANEFIGNRIRDLDMELFGNAKAAGLSELKAFEILY